MLLAVAARRIRPQPGGPVDTTITSSSSLPPPSSGTYDYNNFTPPSLGSAYVDPVFGKTVRTLVELDATGRDSNYTFHWANCDGTLTFHYTGASFNAINTSTGANAYTGLPSGLSRGEVRWSMTDPDKYFYFSGSALMRRNLAAGTNTTLKDFGATLTDQGQSMNYVDRTDRYFVVSYSGSAKVWDSQTDTIYSGPISTYASVGGWVAITPDGNYLVTAAGPTAQPQKEHYSYAINHGTQAVSGSPVQFWGLAGDHGCLLSTSTAANYYICQDNYDTGAMYRVDITVSAAGLTSAQQRAQATSLDLALGFTQDIHLSGVSVGSLQDNFFMCTEDYNDAFNDANFLSEWYARRQEVCSTNVLTNVTRRYCHHRSRDIGADYYYQPHISCSADGSLVLFGSNMNTSGSVGMYAIAGPITSL